MSFKKKKRTKKTMKVVGGHAMPVRDFQKTKKSGTFAHLNNHKIISKEFGKEDNNGHDSVQWKVREKDWYNAERRFIFATPTREL